MTVRFIEKKFSASEALKDYALKKCQKLDRYFGNDSEVQVVFTEEREKDIVEITIMHGGLVFRSQEQTKDMYASIDGAVSSLDRQIQKNKTRLSRRLREESIAKAAPIDETGLQDSDAAYEVVKVKKLSVKPMTVDDAILQMEMLGHEFFFFLNSDMANSHCVVYKRSNGGYGMLVDHK